MTNEERLQALNKIMGIDSNSTQTAAQSKKEPNQYSSSRQLDIIKSAIPFLDREYQRDIYLTVRLMELRNAMAEPELVMMSSQPSADLRRRQLLNAVKPYLDQNSQKQIDMIMNLLRAKNIMSMMGENNG